MSKKSRQEKRAAKDEARRAMEQATLDAAALNASSFAPSAESNAALAEVSRVINMKEAQERRAKKGGAGAKAQRKSGGAGTGKLPAMPRARGAKKARPERPCECGCGGTTKSRFAPGHDSYLRGLCLRVHRGLMTLEGVAKLQGGAIGKAQREAVEREMKEMKKKGTLTKAKVIEVQPKKAKGGKSEKVEKAPEETKSAEAAS